MFDALDPVCALVTDGVPSPQDGRRDLKDRATTERRGIAWLALWLLCGPVLILLLTYLVFMVLLGRVPGALEPEMLWHFVAGLAAVVLAQSVWRSSREFPFLILLASGVLGIVVARLLSSTLPQWLLDDPGEGANLHATVWVVVPQMATLFLVMAAAWAVSYAVLRAFLRHSRSTEG